MQVLVVSLEFSPWNTAMFVQENGKMFHFPEKQVADKLFNQFYSGFLEIS